MTATSQALDAVGLDPAHDHFDVSSCEAEMPQREKKSSKESCSLIHRLSEPLRQAYCVTAL